ncbi:acyl-CoA synthetase [Gordonia caeni]|uniref:Acyl-CoA synthetase n=1 Tax=Gordonia caeni TaxID=1007097 RepID=A0ABP7NUP2_9ACTN
MYPGFHARTTPGKAAVVMADSGETLTYGDLDVNSARLARVLRERGLRPGDHLALLTDNAPRAFEVYWAAMRSGLYITVVNNHLSAEEVAYIVDDCGARAFVTSVACTDVAAGIVDATPAVELRLAYGGPVAGHENYEDVLDGVSAEPLEDEPAGYDMLYSSGTTGRPKGIEAPLPGRPVAEVGNSFVRSLAGPYRLNADTIYLSPAPIYHASPLRFIGAVHGVGGTVVVMRKFDAEIALRCIETYRVTHSQWVPTHFVRMLKLPAATRAGYDVSSMTIAMHSAAPCPVDVKQAMLEWWGPVLYEGYSSTEGHGATFIGPDEWLTKPGSVGRAIVGTLHICDDDGTEVPAGVDGQVYFERKRVSFTYRNDDTKTRSVQHPQHPTWLATGDIGHVDEDGYLYLTDRTSFMIISGGVNIYPQETENVLTMHPAVHDVAVIGTPDPEMGQSVTAVVQPVDFDAAGPELAAELIDYTRGHIAHYKAPRRVDFVRTLPRTETGKLVKRQIADRYLTDQTAAPAAAATPVTTLPGGLVR